MSDRFGKIETAPPIEIFAVIEGYASDTFPQKVNLGVGAYRDDNAKPWVLPVVRDVEKRMANDETLNHEYLGAFGIDEFTKAATSMLLGKDSPAIAEKRAFGIQGISGTGCLKIGADFLTQILKYKIFYQSSPTWANHDLLFMGAGFKECREYRYWSESKKGLDIDGLIEDLRNAPEDSVVILHACAHNPTGCDPTKEQWKLIADVMEERKLFPYFDSAYQGFASGNLDEDAWAVRYFIQRGFELFCAQSFAKNFGLYNERVGNLTIVVNNPASIAAIKSQMMIVIRSMYSTPPNHGARIVATVLNSPELYAQWQESIREMSSRIIKVRKSLYDELKKLKTPGSWEHILTQIGMFSYTGLNYNQSVHMLKKHHIYMLQSGRISMCGINSSNVEYVAKAIHETVTNVK